MVIYEMRCKKCGEYIKTKVKDSDYFNWLVSEDPKDLKLTYDLEIMYYSMKCNKCREIERLTQEG